MKAQNPTSPLRAPIRLPFWSRNSSFAFQICPGDPSQPVSQQPLKLRMPPHFHVVPGRQDANPTPPVRARPTRRLPAMRGVGMQKYIRAHIIHYDKIMFVRDGESIYSVRHRMGRRRLDRNRTRRGMPQKDPARGFPHHQQIVITRNAAMNDQQSTTALDKPANLQLIFRRQPSTVISGVAMIRLGHHEQRASVFQFVYPRSFILTESKFKFSIRKTRQSLPHHLRRMPTVATQHQDPAPHCKRRHPGAVSLPIHRHT
jgi:hypothetical protein